MSVLSAKEYHDMAQQLGKAYKEIRNGLIDSNVSLTGVSGACLISFAASDASSTSSTIDPAGSIAKDTGSTYSDLSVKFTVDKATKIAADYFSTSVKTLNSHVVGRTNTVSGVQTYRNITEYLDGNAATWLNNGQSGYFSTEFREMCGYFGVTVASGYCQANDGLLLP